jgi:hypothetical protein
MTHSNFRCGRPARRAISAWALLLTTLAAVPAVAAEDPGWPRTFERKGQTVVMHQPQVDEWKDYEKMAFRAAIAVTESPAARPIYGVLAVKANTKVNLETRMVLMTDLEPEIRFADKVDKEEDRLQKLVREIVPKKEWIEVSLDRVFAYRADSDAQKKREVEVNLDPPQIFYSSKPAIVVMFMGLPQFKPIKDTQLQFAINTNWDVFFDKTDSHYYLLNGESWLTSSDPLKQPWTPTRALPRELSRLPADANWEDVRRNIPGKSVAAAPAVFVTTQPAELITTDGDPRYQPIQGTKLLYATNTDDPFFMHTGDQNFYFLVAGRWFRAKSLAGPWTAATKDLPPDFALIPEDHPMEYVLASVPGTEQAKDAVLLATIPQKATINIKEAKVTVVYDGEPKFVPIQGTTVQYAVNTQNSVVLVQGQYYCCYQGVWFIAPKSAGPWVVCTAVPQVIYTIPASHPLHNVTYVYVYESTPTTVVVGSTAGYSGQYVAATGVVMFGAGLLLGAAIANNNDDDYHYHYHAGFYSYGCGARYSHYHGGYYRSAVHYGPYGGAGARAAYNPATGVYSRGAYRYGPAGAAGFREAYNPYTNTYAARAGATNGYQSWSAGVVQRGDDWVAGGRQSGPRGSAGWVETSEGAKAAHIDPTRCGQATVAKNKDGDVYVGNNGNVYKKNEDGGWQQRQNGDWSNVESRTTPRTASAGAPAANSTASPSNQSRTSAARSSTNTVERLDYDSQARERGNTRATQQRSARSGGGGGGGRGGRR